MFYLWQDDPGTALHMSDEEREGALARNNALSGYATDAIWLFNKRSRVRWLRSHASDLREFWVCGGDINDAVIACAAEGRQTGDLRTVT